VNRHQPRTRSPPPCQSRHQPGPRWPVNPARHPRLTAPTTAPTTVSGDRHRHQHRPPPTHHGSQTPKRRGPFNRARHRAYVTNTGPSTQRHHPSFVIDQPATNHVTAIHHRFGSGPTGCCGQSTGGNPRLRTNTGRTTTVLGDRQPPPSTVHSPPCAGAPAAARAGIAIARPRPHGPGGDRGQSRVSGPGAAGQPPCDHRQTGFTERTAGHFGSAAASSFHRNQRTPRSPTTKRPPSAQLRPGPTITVNHPGRHQHHHSRARAVQKLCPAVGWPGANRRGTAGCRRPPGADAEFRVFRRAR